MLAATKRCIFEKETDWDPGYQCWNIKKCKPFSTDRWFCRIWSPSILIIWGQLYTSSFFHFPTPSCLYIAMPSFVVVLGNVLCVVCVIEFFNMAWFFRKSWIFSILHVDKQIFSIHKEWFLWQRRLVSHNSWLGLICCTNLVLQFPSRHICCLFA